MEIIRTESPKFITFVTEKEILFSPCILGLTT